MPLEYKDIFHFCDEGARQPASKFSEPVQTPNWQWIITFTRQERSAEIALTPSNRPCSSTDQPTLGKEGKENCPISKTQTLHYSLEIHSQLWGWKVISWLPWLLSQSKRTQLLKILTVLFQQPARGREWKALLWEVALHTLFDTRIRRAHALYSQAIRGTEDDKCDISFQNEIQKGFQALQPTTSNFSVGQTARRW